ncbi:MAG: nucleotidyltransferase family protein [bacterium]
MQGQKLTLNNIVETLRKQKSVLKKYMVKRIGLFGSFARGDQTEKSDIDFVVEFEKPSFDNFMDLSSYLEGLFGRKVDILTPIGVDSIRIKQVADNIRKGIIYV